MGSQRVRRNWATEHECVRGTEDHLFIHHLKFVFLTIPCVGIIKSILQVRLGKMQWLIPKSHSSLLAEPRAKLSLKMTAKHFPPKTTWTSSFDSSQNSLHFKVMLIQHITTIKRCQLPAPNISECSPFLGRTWSSSLQSPFWLMIFLGDHSLQPLPDLPFARASLPTLCPLFVLLPSFFWEPWCLDLRTLGLD